MLVAWVVVLCLFSRGSAWAGTARGASLPQATPFYTLLWERVLSLFTGTEGVGSQSAEPDVHGSLDPDG
jgi:hypothetical protein